MKSGDVLGSYSVVDRLGEGGMGQVFRARDTTLNRDVAIKVLPELFALDAERRACVFPSRCPQASRSHGTDHFTGRSARCVCRRPDIRHVVLNWFDELKRLVPGSAR